MPSSLICLTMEAAEGFNLKMPSQICSLSSKWMQVPNCVNKFSTPEKSAKIWSQNLKNSLMPFSMEKTLEKKTK